MDLIAGTIKSIPEDFVVTEIPLYAPSGEGEHLYLKIRKTDMASDDLRLLLRRTLDITDAEIGMAGTKDKRAVTTQWVSVPRSCESAIAKLSNERIAILDTGVHSNKLRMGHLKGNQFEVRIRSQEKDTAALHADVTRIAAQVSTNGVANYYGEQRFGVTGRNAELGRAIVHGERPKRMAKRKIQLMLSAWQSDLFNQYLARREEQGLLHSLCLGDIMMVEESGGLFRLEDPEKEAAAFADHQITPTGPMFGPKMRRAEGVPGQWEDALLLQQNLTWDGLAGLKKLAPGSRRALLIWPRDMEVRPADDGVWLNFTLPKGAYATTVLNCFLQNPKVCRAD